MEAMETCKTLEIERLKGGYRTSVPFSFELRRMALIYSALHKTLIFVEFDIQPSFIKCSKSIEETLTSTLGI